MIGHVSVFPCVLQNFSAAKLFFFSVVETLNNKIYFNNKHSSLSIEQ